MLSCHLPNEPASPSFLQSTRPKPGLPVKAVVAEAPHVFCEDVSVASVARARDAFMAGDLRVRLGRYHGDNVDGAFWGWAKAWSDPAFRRWNIEPVLPEIHAPVLVIQGEDDPYGTMRQVEAIAAGCAATVRRCVLAHCGHAPHRERSADVLTAGSGRDTFVFAPGSGLDAVADFTPGQDRVMLQGFGFANFTELMAAARDGANVAIAALMACDSRISGALVVLGRAQM